ncbi:MAG: DUF2905 domain-containing protein [Anaerolineales bacterium]|nr:DUF2905 domain-containing protein [Anaerolineales bacterium]
MHLPLPHALWHPPLPPRRRDVPRGEIRHPARIEGEHGSFYFPLTTSILVSVLLTIVVNLIGQLLRK